MISTLSGQQSHKILLMQYTFVLLHSQINCNRFFRPGEIHWLAHHWLNIEKQQISAKAVFYGTLCQVTQFWLKIINISLEMTISRRTGDILTFGLLVPLDWTVIDKSVLKKQKKKSSLLFVVGQQQQKAGYEATSTGSSRTLHRKRTNKKRKRKQRVHTADLPSRLLDSFLNYNKEVFRCFTCTSCPPTHNRPLSACVLSAATPQLRLAVLPPHRGSKILHMMWQLTHFAIVSACAWASVCMCVIWLRVPGWCGKSGYLGSLV